MPQRRDRRPLLVSQLPQTLVYAPALFRRKARVRHRLHQLVERRVGEITHPTRRSRPTASSTSRRDPLPYHLPLPSIFHLLVLHVLFHDIENTVDLPAGLRLVEHL